MKVLYIYRNPKSGYSVGRVFRPIEEEMKQKCMVTSLYLPCYRAKIKDLLKNIQFVKNHLCNNNYDIIHITGDVYYLAMFIDRSKLVVTVHDIGFYTNWKLSFNKIMRYLFWMKPLQKVSKVTFISKKSQKEFLSIIKLKSKQVEYIPNPIDPSFTHSPKSINIDNPNILHVGTQENKNLKNVILALVQINCTLTIIGKLKEEYLHLLDENKIKYNNLVKISDTELLNAYKSADIVSFPSFYEGFGMPIIEAQGVGRPVITSNIEPMKDIAGDDAVLIDPYDIESIKHGFQYAITNYNKIVESGLKNVSKYSAKNIAQQYYNLYKKILHEV